MSINSRMFGSQVPDSLKQKIKALQAASKKQLKPGDKIDDQEVKNIFGEVSNLRGVGGNLSSKTPFVRMWTAVNVAQSIEKSTQPTDIKSYQLKQDEYVKNNKIYKWHNVNDSRRVYKIGNHTLNTLTADPNSQIKSGQLTTDDNKTIASSVVKKLVPYEQETDYNLYMKPPAGITSVSCATDGSKYPHTLKRTTIEFQVHNFSDYERIYTRYFLRPGAQIFVDFGWDTSYLYSPEMLLNGGTDGKVNVESFLYGKNGYVTNSKGDLDTVVGFVTDYSSKVREDGGFDCSVEILSKNGAIVSNTIDDNFKKRVEYGLDLEIMGLAISGVLNERQIYTSAKRWSNSDTTNTTRKELKQAFEIASKTYLGGLAALPGDDVRNQDGKKNGAETLKWGVYYGGNTRQHYELYINFGFFEDKILNKELGFNDIFENDKSAEGNIKSKFNSRNSFITFNKYLQKAMENRFETHCPFLYPKSWGKTFPTYNTLKMTIPDDRQNDTQYYPRKSKSSFGDKGTYRNPASKLPEMKDAKDTIEDIDRRRNRLPLREIFLSVKTLKAIVQRSNTVSELLNNLCDTINDFSKGIVDLSPATNNYAAHTITFIDRNVVKDLHNDDVGTDFNARSDFLKELLTFRPYSADSIVKGYDLDFSMPQGGLGNMLAIQASGTTDTKSMGVTSLLNGLISMEEVERFRADNSLKDLYTRWLPSIGDESGRRLRDNLMHGNTKSFGFDKDDTIYANVGTANNFSRYGDVTWNDSKGEERTNDFENLIGLAIQEGMDIEGKWVKEDEKDEVQAQEKDEDMSAQAANIAAANNQILVDDIFEYYMTVAAQEYSNSVLPLIEAKLTLKIHGISGFMPGDLITVDYLPEQYYTSAFFQVMSIEQEISAESWTTTLETQMRLLPSMNKLTINAQDLRRVRVNKSQVLITANTEAEDAGEYERLKSVIKFFDNLEIIPKSEAFGANKLAEVENIQAVYKTSFIMTPYNKPGEESEYSYVQIDDKEIYNQLKGVKKTNKQEEKAKPKTGSLIGDYNAYKYSDGKKKLWIEDKGWLRFDGEAPEDAKGTAWTINDYVYVWNLDKSQCHQGDEVYIIVSSKKNWYILPPDPAMVLKYGPTIDLFFRKGQETYTEINVATEDKEKELEQLKTELQARVDAEEITEDEMNAILESYESTATS